MVIEHVNGKNKGTVMLYALSTCGWCRMTRELLTNLGIEFSYVYVDLLSGDELIKVTGELQKFNTKNSFPTLVIDNKKVIIGYRDDEIMGALS
jgi:glutaredoxin-like protein NrdH